MRKILVILFVLISFSTFAQTGKFGYETIQQTYGGDTLTTTLGTDTVEFATTTEAYNFDKPLYVDGQAISMGGGFSGYYEYRIDSLGSLEWSTETNHFASLDSLALWAADGRLGLYDIFSATITSGNTTITGITDASNANLNIGDYVTRLISTTGIPYNSIILSKGNEGGDANTIVISNAPTTSATVNLYVKKPKYAIVNGNQVITNSIYFEGLNIINRGNIIGDDVIMLDVDVITPLIPYTFDGSNGAINLTGTTSRLYYESAAVSSNTFNHICKLDFGYVIDEGLQESIYINRYNSQPFYGKYNISGNINTIGDLALFTNTNTVTTNITGSALLSGIDYSNCWTVEQTGVIECPSAITVLSMNQVRGNAIFNGTYVGTVSIVNGTQSSYIFNCKISGSGITSTATSGTSIFNGDLTCNYTQNTTASFEHDCHINGKIMGTVFMYDGDLFLNSKLNGQLYQYGGRILDNTSNNGMVFTKYRFLSGGEYVFNGYAKGISFEMTGTSKLTISSGATIESTNANLHPIELISGTPEAIVYGRLTGNQACIKKTVGELSLINCILDPTNGLNPIWCTAATSASRDVKNYGLVTNYLDIWVTPYTGGQIPNDTRGGFTFED